MRRIVRVLGILAVLLLVAAISLPFLINVNQFKPRLEATLTEALGRQVTIGDLKTSIFSGGVRADGLAIAEDPAFGKAPFLEAKSLNVGVELWPLIASRKLNVTRLTIERPEVRLLQAPSGRWNYSSLGGKPAGTAAQAAPSEPAPAGAKTMDVSAKVVRILGGRFSMGPTSARQKPLVLEQVNLEVRNFSPRSSFPFTLTARVAGGGEIKLDGKAGPLDGADAELTPFSARIDIEQLNLTAALAGTAPDVGGVATLRGKVQLAGGRLSFNGKLNADGLKLAKNGSAVRKPVELDFALVEDLRQHVGVVERGDVRAGAAAASLTGTVSQAGDATNLDLRFAGRNMPVPELAGLLPAVGIALPAGSRLEGGVATVLFTLKGPADRVIADGTVALNNTRLANFDLGTKMALVQKLAGIQSVRDTDIQTFSANLRISPAGIEVRDLRLVAPAIAQLSGNGAVSPNHALDFKMSAMIQTSRSALLSRTAVPFFIQGTAENPVFKPDVQELAKTEARGLVQSEVQKQLPGNTGKAISNALDKLLGGKKPQRGK
jgi:AsmA protein